MNSSIFVPKTINVGYQNRSGTYTGKLAYVIYYDEKVSYEKKHRGIVGVTIRFQMMNLRMFQQKDLYSIRKLAITLQDGIIDMLIVEYMIQEDLSLKLPLKIYYTFSKMRIVSRVRDLKENLYMGGMVKI